MIESFVEGRIRLRSPLFNDKKTAETLCALLRDVEGVLALTFNPKTNGMLVEYDPKRIPLFRIMNALPLFKRLQSLEGLPVAKRGEPLNALLVELRALFPPKQGGAT